MYSFINCNSNFKDIFSASDHDQKVPAVTRSQVDLVQEVEIEYRRPDRGLALGAHGRVVHQALPLAVQILITCTGIWVTR